MNIGNTNCGLCGWTTTLLKQGDDDDDDDTVVGVNSTLQRIMQVCTQVLYN